VGIFLPVTASQAVQRLMDGNRRYVDTAQQPLADEARSEEVSGGQKPFAVVLTCSDSRGVPELIFDQGVGDLYVIRVAGNVLDPVVVASIQYAVSHLDCRLIVVLGHESCGAVTTALGPYDDLLAEPSSIVGLVNIIRKNIPRSLAMSGPDIERVDHAVEENAAAVVSQLEHDSGIAPLVANDTVVVRRACYSLSTGIVTFSDAEH
jgi:carbonic anhydrase